MIALSRSLIAAAATLAWATEWKSLEKFEELLVERLTGSSVPR